MTNRYQPHRGDIVRVGKGTKLWTVDRLWEDAPGGQILPDADPRARAVSLLPAEGYTGTSCTVDRLTHVSRPATDDPAPGELVIRYSVPGRRGNPRVWPLETEPHALVAGPAGAGKTSLKTSFLRAMAMAAINRGMDVYGCDPRRRGLVGVPGRAEVATDVAAMATLITRTHALMQQRYTQLESGELGSGDLTPVLLILDEFALLQAQLDQAWQHDPDTTCREHPARALVRQLLACGRSARIHLAIGLPHADAKLLDAGSRDNLRHRVWLTPDGAEPGAGASQPVA